MSSSDYKQEEGVTNILVNGLQPVDVRKLPQVFGVLEYVSAEVFVSYMCRWLFKTEKRTLMELAAIHAVSIPFIGGLGAFAGVAHRSEPPRISALQRRSHRGIAVGAGSTAEVFGFQRGKGIAESRASGQPRDDMEPRVAVGEVKRGVELGAVGLQVVAAEAAALVLHIPRHRGPEVSIIKRARPVPRDLVKAEALTGILG